MRIANITVENYKIFKGKHSFDFEGNLIFLVGENNSGKSTLFEAVNFVKLGLPKEKKVSDVRNKLSLENAPVSCSIKFTGQIKDVIRDFSEAKYEPYVFEESGIETILVQRSSEDKVIKQNGKDKSLSIKTVTIWNPASNQFENPSGIDSVLSTLFEAQFIWADTDPSDVSDFGSTKICGRLLTEAVGDFFDGDQWKIFTKIHQQTFHGDGDSLSKRTQVVEGKIKTILNSQYGDVDVRFNFSLPETSAFYKAGDVTVNDGVLTKLQDKGTGMQRAVSLAMIQVYAQNLVAHTSIPEKSKPLFFFIDEPEICLHPRAQKQLLNALIEISKVQQIYIATHSPYLLRSFDSTKHDLLLFRRVDKAAEVTTSSLLKLFNWSPSWGEINHAAYGLPTIEFHDELYGALNEKYITSGSDDAETSRRSSIKNFDFEILANSDKRNQTKKWSELKKGKQQDAYPVTLQTFIRNRVHHPESTQSEDFSEIELAQSIDYLISLITTST